MKGVTRLLERVVRSLRSDADRIGPAGKLARAVPFLILFCPWYAVVAIASRLGVRFELDGRSAGGMLYRLQPPDLVQTYILLFGVWEPDVTAFIRSRLAAGDGFVDVGANIGYYAIEAAPHVGANGCVVAIEASPSIFARLVESIERNPDAAHVRAVNKAADAAPGRLEIYRGPAHNLGLTSTVRHRRSRRWSAETEVETAPLADLLEPSELERVKLVKIDVEGAEPAVLAGMSSFLDRCRDDVEILIELSPSWWPDAAMRPIDVLQPLFDRGFNAYEIGNDYWPWRSLWPRVVRRPRRHRGDLTGRPKRIDLVLSRVNAEVLA